MKSRKIKIDEEENKVNTIWVHWIEFEQSTSVNLNDLFLIHLFRFVKWTNNRENKKKGFKRNDEKWSGDSIISFSPIFLFSSKIISFGEHKHGPFSAMSLDTWFS